MDREREAYIITADCCMVNIDYLTKTTFCLSRRGVPGSCHCWRATRLSRTPFAWRRRHRSFILFAASNTTVSLLYILQCKMC